MALLRAVGAYHCSGDKKTFCDENFVRRQGLIQIDKLRCQLARVGKGSLLGRTD